MEGFVYPPVPHVRRHGPDGYQDYESYRDWLRDEFMFRCVYCLHREKWYGRGATFQIDHFVPTSSDPTRVLDYTNLVYSCATCNTAKLGLLGIPNPCEVAFGDCLEICEDGRIRAIGQSSIGETLIKNLRLNSKKNLEQRFRWIRTLAVLRVSAPDIFREYMSFPSDLPDLREKQPPFNSRASSVEICYFAQRERGELPLTY